uniref:Ribonuclease P/MRP subunit p14 n=1 Tax=Cyanoderma ruficeps TaxID=181631 RepID=A0A8C3NW71_9PASS
MAAAAFERRVLRRAAEHHYLRVRLELPDGGARPNAAQFKQLVVTALRELHGEVGAALPVDVLTYEEKTLSAILRVISSGLVKLWSALTLLGFYQNRRCAFRVLQVKPCGAGWLPPDVSSGSKLGRLPKPTAFS